MSDWMAAIRWAKTTCDVCDKPMGESVLCCDDCIESGRTTAFAAGRAAERKAVVGWLREPEMQPDGKMVVGGMCEHIAELIERGQHVDVDGEEKGDGR